MTATNEQLQEIRMSRDAPLIDSPYGRKVREWVGKTPNSRPPPNVRLRILDRNDRRDYLTGVAIESGDVWDAEHVKPLWAGGENRETNLRPALRTPHKQKTKAEAKQRAKERKLRKAHFGIKKKVRLPMPCGKASKWKKKMNGQVVRR